MEVRVKFNEINVREEKCQTLVRVLMLKGEKGDPGTIDPSDYYNKTETNALLDTKVDKVSGKGLSTEDYTAADKTKLANIESEANKTIIEQATGSSTSSVMSQDAVTTQLNTKATTNLYTATLLSLSASLSDVFLSVDSLRFPIINAHGR